MPENVLDINENDFSPEILAQLLRDHTTGRNIFWATHDYEHLGEGYQYADEIRPACITGENGQILKPRVLKSKEQQTDRSKDMAEVFTPSWVVKKMVDYVDFDVNTLCLELTCGEAPFLVSRYDATTGEPIAIGERVGMLDRKLRMIHDEQLSEGEWLVQVRQAFQSTYGYEWQGDSLLLARENLLFTFVDYYEARFGSKPDMPLLQDFAEIIAWNLWQMDGLTYRIPREKQEEPPQVQLSLFEEAPLPPPAPLCVIKDWQKGKTIKVNNIKKRQTKNQAIMKFDVIIGNPPYQEEKTGENQQFAPPVYNYFIDEAQKIGIIVELIHPARFLFNAGRTPRDWNEKMLNDSHFKILKYQQESNLIFGNSVEIKGGVAISYWDSFRTFGAIKQFTSYEELNSILHKVINAIGFKGLDDSIYLQNKFNLENLYADYPYFERIIGSEGKDKRFRNNIFDKIDIFTEFSTSEGDIPVYGVINNKRVWRYLPSKYFDLTHENLQKWKVLVARVNGIGILGEVLSSPLICGPRKGFTQTFLGIGAFESKEEAESCLKYLKTKFCRTLLGVLKITQMNNKDVWRYVPLQDFTPSSDIDWSKSIAEIDEQLFDKYGLDEQERNFIRTKVKEMT